MFPHYVTLLCGLVEYIEWHVCAGTRNLGDPCGESACSMEVVVWSVCKDGCLCQPGHRAHTVVAMLCGVIEVHYRSHTQFSEFSEDNHFAKISTRTHK